MSETRNLRAIKENEISDLKAQIVFQLNFEMKVDWIRGRRRRRRSALYRDGRTSKIAGSLFEQVVSLLTTPPERADDDGQRRNKKMTSMLWWCRLGRRWWWWRFRDQPVETRNHLRAIYSSNDCIDIFTWRTAAALFIRWSRLETKFPWRKETCFFVILSSKLQVPSSNINNIQKRAEEDKELQEVLCDQQLEKRIADPMSFDSNSNNSLQLLV